MMAECFFNELICLQEVRINVFTFYVSHICVHVNDLRFKGVGNCLTGIHDMCDTKTRDDFRILRLRFTSQIQLTKEYFTRQLVLVKHASTKLSSVVFEKYAWIFDNMYLFASIKS